MKKSTKCIVAVALIIAIISAVVVNYSAVSLFASEGYYYSIDTSTTASVYGRYTDDPDVVIAREFSNHYITEIAGNAFSEDTNAVTLDMSAAELLEKIGNYAFYNCSNLSGEIAIAGRVNSIGLSAFQGCGLIDTVTFYSGYVTLIPEQCFYMCGSLSSVTLPANLQRIEKLAFANCTSLTEITIPASVTYISPSAFDGCSDLVINCYTDSYAQQFAQENGFEYVLIDIPEPTEPETEPETEPGTEPETEPETEPGTEPETEPETELETEPETEPGTVITFLLGDADGDGIITITDVTLIQRILSEIATDPDGMIELRSSIDGDSLNITHATKIQRFLADIPVPDPINTIVTKILF